MSIDHIITRGRVSIQTSDTIQKVFYAIMCLRVLVAIGQQDFHEGLDVGDCPVDDVQHSTNCTRLFFAEHYIVFRVEEDQKDRDYRYSVFY